MRERSSSKVGDLPAMLRVTRTAHGHGESSAARRRIIADFCRMIGVQLGALPPVACLDRALSPRQRQTLERLLAGDSEKEAAAHLGVSRHTVHIYVKGLYRHFQVSSRGELLAHCLGNHTAR